MALRRAACFVVVLAVVFLADAPAALAASTDFSGLLVERVERLAAGMVSPPLMTTVPRGHCVSIFSI
ncbi:exported protein of unknown function [Denitratisoma oestradiolicum]|uniref:Uncharacterized protein n=1 Tax=Denitratisoma oestradiolicum TaxID=311182 RepID=A0A6S6XXH1_9PROT|nr:exported protein of unknown function [Denitratisoma oestradiolicum]